MGLIWMDWASVPAVLLKLYIYGYLNRIQSSRRLEREAQRNVELMWLTGRLMPDFKTIANFRKDNGPAIRKVCRQFIVLCRRLTDEARSEPSKVRYAIIAQAKPEATVFTQPRHRRPVPQHQLRVGTRA
jgi:Transposase domain (DUF772)